jgi:hypothetical protein
VTATTGRAIGPNGNLVGEIDYTRPDLYVVTLACGACHTGQAAGPNGRIVLEGAPNTQFDVRKWRQAFSTTRAQFLSPAQIGTRDAPGETTRRIIEIIDSKPAGFFARGLPRLDNEAAMRVDATQRAIVKGNLVPILQSFSTGTAVRAAAVMLQTRPGSSYGNGDRSPGLAGHSAGQSDGSGDLLVDLLATQKISGGMTPEAFVNGTYPELPPFATVTDAPAVWNQADRSVAMGRQCTFSFLAQYRRPAPDHRRPEQSRPAQHSHRRRVPARPSSGTLPVRCRPRSSCPGRSIV